MSQVLSLQDCREDGMKMGKHFGKLKTAMQMRCMIILLPLVCGHLDVGWA